jgi:hypothetical protein
MIHSQLHQNTLELLLSFVLPYGCFFSVISDYTYRISCPDDEIAHRVWENRVNCIFPLFKSGQVLEVVASNYYARSHPKS